MRAWLYNNIYQPVQNFYHQYILRETDWTNDTYSATQETSDSLAAHTASSDNDIL